MTAILLSPHQDDETLFAAYTCLARRPHIVTVFRSVNQEANGITAAEREAEQIEAAVILGCTLRQWAHPDDDPDWAAVRYDLADLRDRAPTTTVVYAPWPEEFGGHPQHDAVGELARKVFGKRRVRYYATYRVGGPRTKGTPVEPEPWMIRQKLLALACYRSQIERGPRRFFTHALDEWTRP
jgi:LmbE family N-acetylglucosaminyl deacetylase